MLYLGAISLGALHAFEPGHGKSIIAAYMLGTRGRAIDGITLGFIVTLTHTFSVIILGVIATLLSHSFSDEQLHIWLGLVSSLLILSVGLWMFKQRLTGNGNLTHFHFFCKDGPNHHHHDHDHHMHASPIHDEEHAHHHGNTDQEVAVKSNESTDMWKLLMLGVSGGMVPCPPAIVALLAAIGAGRTAQGLTVTLFFSLGLGLVMMAIGIVLSQAGRLTEKVSDNKALGQKLGILSAFIIILLGCYTMYHSLTEIF